MEYSEQEQLIKKVKGSESVIKPTWRHGMILPVTLGIMFGGQLINFVQNEWTQNTIKTEYFPDSTTNFSGCNSHNKSDPAFQDYQTVQQHSANWQTFYCLAENIPTGILQLVLPSYTDSYGRKFLLVLTTLGITIKTIGITLTVYFKASFNFMIISNVAAGLSGSIFGLFSATFSLVADLTTSKSHRTFGIVLIEAFLLFGNILASYFSGYFIEDIQLGYYKTAIIGASTVGFSFVLSIFIPESLHHAKRSERKPVFRMIKRMASFYISKDFKGKRAAYTFLLFSFSCAIIAGINRGNMETLYFLGQPFCWDSSKIGIFIMVRSVMHGLVGIASLKLLQMCISDTVIGIVSPISNSMSYMIEAFSKTTTTIYIVPCVGMFAFLVVPIIRSLMSSMTSIDKQGAVFAGLSVIEVISTILANLSQNVVYSLTMSFMNGFVFLILAVIALINSLLMLAYKYTKHAREAHQITVQVKT